ncbi:MAG TPA: NAD-dependent epimerase/dehydratase family protein [Acidimicrobiia bacterium]
MPPAKRSSPGLTVAVTGPTGDLGQALVGALERSRSIKRIVGMARRPFDPSDHGWKKTEYRRGDVLDRASVEALFDGADVVVHLAFIIMGGRDETRSINLEGSRNVFEAALASGAQRLVYASSVAAYGFHADNPDVLTEDVAARGTDDFYYSAQKAELEELLSGLLDDSEVDAYIFRPSIVSGPTGGVIMDNIPYLQLGARLPGPVRRLLEVMPVLKPVVPDPGIPFQLVHHDDVATAMRAAVQGRGSPGVYNLAGDGRVTMSDLADAMGWYSIPLPELGAAAAAELTARLPFMPPEAAWLQAFRVPVLMDTAKAKRELKWRPKYTTRETLDWMVAAAREEQRY